MRLAIRPIMSSVSRVAQLMNIQVGPKEFAAMMLGAIQQVKEGEKYLSELDSACGDGDHGITMLRAVTRLEKTLADGDKSDLKTLVYDLGWTLLGIDGGATGPLLGSLFLGMSETLAEETSLDPAGVAQMFEQGLQAVQKQTKAKVGDRTMLDALVPAVSALRDGAGRSESVTEILSSAADSAHEGALATRNMVARFGKARFSAERSLGHQDPGATSTAMMFRGFYEGFAKIHSD
jgi:phosphoenolpyruvate---glycerone phosphotransferase subunit DhaL